MVIDGIEERGFGGLVGYRTRYPSLAFGGSYARLAIYSKGQLG
jgi:hypothetical protein